MFSNKDGYRHEGEWVNDAQHGHGLETFPTGSYDGNFVNGKKEGFGRLKVENDGTYEGEFVNDMFHGQGKYHWLWEDKTYSG